MAQPISGLTIGLGLDTTGIDQGMKQLRSKLSLVNSEMRANMSAFDRGERSVGKYETQISTLNRKLDVQKAAVAETRREYEKMVQQHGEGSRQAEHAARAYNNQVSALNNTERSVEQLNNELRQLQDQQRLAASGWTRTGEALTNTSQRMKKLGDGMKNIGRSMSMYVTAPLTAMGAGAFKAAVDFESAFAGVKKTVDTSAEGFAVLEKGIRDMAKELPVSANNIAEVAESAGQLGIAEENILGFTKTIIDLGESTNLTREQAATEFARFANIVQMPQDSFDRLGSSVVALGKNYCPAAEKLAA